MSVLVGEYTHCPHCYASFSFRKPDTGGRCPWCSNLVDQPLSVAAPVGPAEAPLLRSWVDATYVPDPSPVSFSAAREYVEGGDAGLGLNLCWAPAAKWWQPYLTLSVSRWLLQVGWMR